MTCRRLIPKASLLAILVGVSLILAAAVAAVPGDDEPPQPTDGLPTVDEILQRHIDAVGGEEAIRRHSHRTCTGTVEIPALEIEGEVRILRSVPCLFLMEADLGEHGTNRTGYDGVMGWTIDEINGPTLLEDARLEELRRQADFHADLNFRQHYESIEVLGRSKFHELATFELKMVDRSGKDVMAYFSEESGLHVGLKGTLESHEGPMPAETLIAGYKRFDGVLLPTRYETHFRDIVQLIRIEKVTHELIDEETFDVPHAVRALQDAKDRKGSEPHAE